MRFFARAVVFSSRCGKCAREKVSNQFSQRTFKISLWRQREQVSSKRWSPVVSSKLLLRAKRYEPHLRHFTSNRRKGLSGGVRGGSSSSRRIKYRALFTPPMLSRPAGQPGSYLLQAQPVIFGQFPLGFGPVKQVQAIASPIIALQPPVLANDQVILNFTISGVTNSSFKLLQANQVNAGWTTNGTAVFSTNVSGSSYRFATTNGPAMRFYRIQSP